MGAVRIAVAGASGRMGRLVLEQVLAAEDVTLAGALEHPGSPEVGSDAGALLGRPTGVRITGDPRVALASADVVIDFSSPSATAGVLEAAAAQGVACVVGTTGLDGAAVAAIEFAAARPKRVARSMKAPRSSFTSALRVIAMMLPYMSALMLAFSPSGMFFDLNSPDSLTLSSTPNEPLR